MTMRIAILLFLVSFTSITCWLLCRKPAVPLSVATPLSDQPAGTDSTISDDIAPARQLNSTEDDVIALSDAERYIHDKLNRVTVPLVDFDQTSLSDAVDFLRLRARELDTSTTDSHPYGISFTIRMPNQSLDIDGQLDHHAGVEPTYEPQTISGRLENKTLSELLHFICKQTGCRWEITDQGVIISPIAP